MRWALRSPQWLRPTNIVPLATVASACGLTGCTYDFDSPFAAQPPAARDSGVHDGALPEASSDADASDGAPVDAAWPESSVPEGAIPEGCVPVCEGRCQGADDSCGSTCAVSGCNDGQVCTPSGACCTPTTCPQLGAGCGAHDDGCGHPMDCGTCAAANSFCLDGSTCTALDLVMETIPSGFFQMGSPANEPGRSTYEGYPDPILDETQHVVTLSHSYLIANREISQGVFEAVMGYNPSHFSACGADCPVEMVTWDEASAFCNRLSETKGLPLCFSCSGSGPSVSCSWSTAFASPYDCAGFRLPTEAEWERAARAETIAAFYSGAIAQTGCDPVDSNLASIGWYLGNSAVSYAGGGDVTCGGNQLTVGTHPSAQLAANNFGLYDVAGNVWEWTLDCSAAYPSGLQTDPVAPSSCASSYHVFRGGGLGNNAEYCRHAERVNSPGGQGGRNLDIGLRPVRLLN